MSNKWGTGIMMTNRICRVTKSRGENWKKHDGADGRRNHIP
jgi:hypothetical protein